MVMQIIVVDPNATQVPWLEAQDGEASPDGRIEVSSLPFSVGRSKTADHFLNSPKISRIQARIVRVGNQLCVRDTGSTNGTFVNGRRVQESLLHDGDEIAFADIKFTFHLPAPQNTPEAAIEEIPTPEDTEPSAEPALSVPPQRSVRDVINRIRQMHEVIIHRAFANKFLPIVRLDNHAVVGMDYLGVDEALFGTHTSDLLELLEVDCPLTHSLCDMLRLAAIEDFLEGQRAGFLFLRVRGVEVVRESLLWELCKLGNLVQPPAQVVVGLPAAVVADGPDCRDIVNYIRSLGLGVAFTDFDGGPEELRRLGLRAGDFLCLASSMTSEIELAEDRQERLMDVAKAAIELEAGLIATEIQSATEAKISHAAGCHLAQGAFFTATN